LLRGTGRGSRLVGDRRCQCHQRRYRHRVEQSGPGVRAAGARSARRVPGRGDWRHDRGNITRRGCRPAGACGSWGDGEVAGRPAAGGHPRAELDGSPSADAGERRGGDAATVEDGFRDRLSRVRYGGHDVYGGAGRAGGGDRPHRCRLPSHEPAVRAAADGLRGLRSGPASPGTGWRGATDESQHVAPWGAGLTPSSAPASSSVSLRVGCRYGRATPVVYTSWSLANGALGAEPLQTVGGTPGVAVAGQRNSSTVRVSDHSG